MIFFNGLGFFNINVDDYNLYDHYLNHTIYPHSPYHLSDVTHSQFLSAAVSLGYVLRPGIHLSGGGMSLRNRNLLLKLSAK